MNSTNCSKSKPRAMNEEHKKPIRGNTHQTKAANKAVESARKISKTLQKA